MPLPATCRQICFAQKLTSDATSSAVRRGLRAGSLVLARLLAEAGERHPVFVSAGVFHTCSPMLRPIRFFSDRCHWLRWCWDEPTCCPNRFLPSLIL